jgi:phosphatidylserine/phosphatidylglycerophosphate/cardiolipin synthase-like enzyme
LDRVGKSVERAVATLATASAEHRALILAWLDLPEAARPPEPSAPSELVEATNELLKQVSGSPHGSLAVLLMLATSVRATALARAPSVELIWTGPSVVGSKLRSTRQVLSEILREARGYVLVVGYQLRSALQEGDASLVDEFLDAARRGVRFTFVLNEDEANFTALDLARWPSSSRARVLTWPRKKGDFASLHAKIVVADDQHALITSANLTLHGLRRNIEVGVLVRGGDVVVQLRRHFVELEREHILAPVG